MKAKIVERLGGGELLLPVLVAEGLAANDRIKVRLSVLQAAAAHALTPEAPAIDLSPEARAAGLDPLAFERQIAGTRSAPPGRLAIPELGALMAEILADLAAMHRAVAAGDTAAGEAAAARLAAIGSAIPAVPEGEIEVSEIQRLTRVASGEGDSLHRLVMDLHKSLNRLAAACAEEVVAGAHAYGLTDQDRACVEAFMRGLDATRALKFDHPGLDTTAFRSGSRLTIQNDIGETDAHVVMIAVENGVVTLTYTDVHRGRARFFTGLFDRYPVSWSGLDRQRAEGLGDEEAFYLVTGRLEAAEPEQAHAFLEAIGAALVFLIDWNKARKVLRAWVARGEAVRILDWAARNRIGHRAFLELGGGELVASAVRHATPARIGFGERLDAALGHEMAIDFLKAVLRLSTEAMLGGKSARLVRDRIEAELIRHLERVDTALLAIVIRQAGLAREIAAAIAHHLACQQAGRPADGAVLAQRAKRIEEKADRIAIEARGEIQRLEADATIEQLVVLIEEAVDELEQAAFIASLLPPQVDAALLKPLADLAQAATAGAEAAAAGVDAATEVPEGAQSDSEDALAAVGRLIDLEHLADNAERAVTALALSGNHGLATALSGLELARALERATDRLAGFGHVLRRHMLADLSA